MRRRQQLLVELKHQRKLLDDLITTIGSAEKLDIISPAYDQTTRTIEKNLLELRKSFFKTRN